MYLLCINIAWAVLYLYRCWVPQGPRAHNSCTNSILVWVHPRCRNQMKSTFLLLKSHHCGNYHVSYILRHDERPFELPLNIHICGWTRTISVWLKTLLTFCIFFLRIHQLPNINMLMARMAYITTLLSRPTYVWVPSSMFCFVLCVDFVDIMTQLDTYIYI